MKIVTCWYSTPALWGAVDDDTYDGALDSHCQQGFGRTEAEAIADLQRQLAEEADDQEPFRNGPDTNF